MFEAQVLHLLRRYLGNYVHGISAEALRISVWKGDVVLKDLQLKAEALNSLQLPVTVKAGFIGSITLKVPWKSLGKEPVIVLIDQVFVLARPASDYYIHKEEDRERLFEAKLQQIEELELAAVEATSKSKAGIPQPGNSWLGSLLATIIGNLKISISNIHIRYEDCDSNSGHPFSVGVTLAKLAAVTVDDQGNETFDTSGALDKLQKSLQLERLAVYHDCNSLPWTIDKRWEDLSPKEWVEIFEDGINEPVVSHNMSKWATNRRYLVPPINGVTKYHRLGKQERNDPDVPYEAAFIALTDVSLTLTEGQYHDWIKLFEVVSRYWVYLEVSHLRPMLPVSRAPHLWWHYASRASLQQKKIYQLSWDQIRHVCQLRRRYVQLYAGFLQQSLAVKNSDLRDIERDLDPKVILLWRLLARAKVESVKSKEAAEQQKAQKSSWFSFKRFTGFENNLTDASEGSELAVGKLTKEEWQAINSLLNYQQDEELASHCMKDMQNMICFLVAVSISQAVVRIINRNEIEVVCGRCDQLLVSTKLRHQSTEYNVSLKFYGLSAPEGSLVQSVSNEQKMNALAATFMSSPGGESVDWELSATVSPCYVMVLVESYNRFMEFVKRSNAVSPSVTLETTAVLQMKIEKVTRRAQEQFQMVLEEQSRFSLDIDLAAPKVIVPIRPYESSKCESHLHFDFGSFTLHTEDSHSTEQSQSIYSRFYISGRDIAAFFVECGSDSHNCVLASPTSSNQHTDHPLQDESKLLPLIERCGMAVIVDKIKAPHPSFPPTRISIQVPNLAIHFSPSRYHRLMELQNIWYDIMEISGKCTGDGFQTAFVPWNPVDLANDARILVWKGIANSMAKWKPCFLVLSGCYLYILESENSNTYQRCLSMAGRQLHEIPPANIGGSQFCLAVSSRGVDIHKALEVSSTWVLEFRDGEEKSTWLKGLIQATYQASAPSSVYVLGETDKCTVEVVPSLVATNSKAADLVVNGSLVETKLFIYGKAVEIHDESLEETLILEVLASGGKVHMTTCEGDLTVKTRLHSLQIKDELQGHFSECAKYLAYSVVKSETLPSSPYANESSCSMDMYTPKSEEDDFKDALSDYESSICSTHLGSHFARMGDISGIPGFDSMHALMFEMDCKRGKGFSGDTFSEVLESDHEDFVSVNFARRDSGSLDYEGIDSQMTVSMSKLEFFCNRPTLVALIGFGNDLSSVSSMMSEKEIHKTPEGEDLSNRVKDDGDWPVKGLLGFGKGRVVFNLYMNVDSVCLFLNKEDGSQLAMIVQESFQLDIKVYPSSLSIESTLGNFKLCDMSLEADNCWSWLCDIRNPGVDSLIKFKFNSYSAEDDDYEGYDYSLSGRLSAVRLVFLYRFVQEVTVYFMELASQQTGEAVKLVDRVGDIEWLINKYEIDGSSAVKLDVSLDTPIIIVPRTSISKEFIQLDLGQLQVTNEVSWYGSPEKDPSAVRIDVLHTKLLGLNMSIGVDGCVGKPMIRKGRGFDAIVRRSLRDVFKKVPTFSLELEVDLLHVVMSDREYNIIRDCLIMNLVEEPRLPPSFHGSSPASKETMRLLADKVNLNSQILLSRTVTIVAVGVNSAMLELCNGDQGSPLAHISLESMWVSYRMTSLSEADLYITVLRLSVLDARPETKSEMRMMLGSSYHSSKQTSRGDFPLLSNRESLRRIHSGPEVQFEAQNPTMFVMDYKCRTSSQSLVVRIQQPKILFVPDFLLAVGEFFVPSLGAIIGKEETIDPRDDPIAKRENIVLSEAVYKQEEDMVHLSPKRQLVADALGVDEYIYDGCGKIICLSEGIGSRKCFAGRHEPIIIIGCGKKLRFVNVKIKNGSLLREHTFLSNDSSYSSAFEDCVEILEQHKSVLDEDKKNPHNENKSLGISSVHLTSPSDSQSSQSFSFEGQVISPEFTFYNSAKSFLNDTSQGEKLLRARLDFSFMYAAKEKDTWIHALVKDLMVEAGSGHTVLHPVDFSAGYTSVGDKTSISMQSTDVCIHLSLSSLALFMNLLNQVSLALQFGNRNPLAPCTNFDRIWVSPKETRTGNNIAFWRPQAPPNYVVLGDCMTSRPYPPSRAVMAVSNIYGRARKPTGFTLIGVFSGTQGFEMNEEHSLIDADAACYIWMPIAPPGYKALGCVVHSEAQPPPNHVVYCIRSDLVTSTMYSECMFIASSNLTYPSGFSIWRLDNGVGSFYAHASTGCPPKDYGLDLGHIILCSAIQRHSSKESALDSSQCHHDGGQHKTGQRANSSGWDVLRSVSKATKFYTSTPQFERIWLDKGSDVGRPVSIWRPIARSGYAVLGDCITEGLEPPAVGIIFKADNPDIATKPLQFTKVAHAVGKGVDEIFFWFPIAPPGYVSLGCVVSRAEEVPPSELFCCPRMDLVNQANIFEVPISRSTSSRGQCWSIWRVENQACTFLARSDMKKPSARLAYSFCDSVKPKTQDNVAVDMGLRRLSLTVLDSLYGSMTPLYDATITNIKLATHGRSEEMNAVLISSIAASAFNTQLEAWEPLIEPFDGIFKFETFATSEHSPSVLRRRLCVASTSILNINVTTANLETFVETAVSWRRIMELEQRAAKLSQEASRKGRDPDFSALNEDDFQAVIVENKLGCDIFLKRLEDNIVIVDLLHNDEQALISVPPPRFSDRLNVADEFREAHQYVAVQILEAKDLPTIDDGNSYNFLCALRLVVNGQATDQHQRVFAQSARTRCVKPSISENKGIAKWSELFIFEVPRKGPAQLEVEVTNLAAKAGKGEVIGSFSLPVGHGANRLKKLTSARIHHQAFDVGNVSVCPLKIKVDQNNTEQIHVNGNLSVSTYYFERKSGGKITEDVELTDDTDRDAGFWVGVSSEGEWESVKSLLPVSVIPKSLTDDFVAMEVTMINGKKHITLRGLVTVVNDSDIKMEIVVCPISSVNMSDISSSSGCKFVIEEIFQNQHYDPMFGWGNQRLGEHGNDPDQWSTKDFSYTSKDFFEPALPPGWKWQSQWTIDKSQYVDTDGWAYAPYFQCLSWPPTSKSSTKSPSDTVRQRRWIRTRQQITDQGGHGERSDFHFTTISPRSSADLPWRSTLRNSDDCFLVRPYVEPPGTPFSWGSPVSPFGDNAAKDQASNDQGSFKQKTAEHEDMSYLFKVNQLGKKDVLLSCHRADNKQCWLSVGTDVSVLHTELNAPVYDWKISVSSPFELENRLPCSAEFTLWEKTKDGNFVERHSGVIKSRKGVHIYSVDLVKPMYLSLYAQGGWIVEKDPVLILDTSSKDPISSFWIIHQLSRRRLRVNIELKLGGNISAPKAIRFFVPYWIVNDTHLPLVYRMVELEYVENAESDTVLLSRAVNSSRTGMRNPTNSIIRRYTSPRRNLEVLETIEDSSPVPSMLSPQDYFGGNALHFSSQKDAFISPRIGICVAVSSSETSSPGISLHELEDKERVDVNAHSSHGSYYKLSAYVKMTSDRTKVVHFQPQILFVNRVGRSICLQQCDSQLEEWIHPSGPPKIFEWQSSSKVELLKLRVEGYKWSSPFSVSTEGMVRIFLQRDDGSDKIQLKVEVRSGTKSSRYEVLFCPNSFSSPYRIENRSMFLPIHFRQADASSDSWQFLLPNAAASFLWEDLGKRKLLEVLVGGTDTDKTEKYDIDDISDYQPVHVDDGPVTAVRVTVSKEEKVNVVRITDWMGESESTVVVSGILQSPIPQLSRNDMGRHISSASEGEFHLVVDFAELGLSVVDHTPEEILYLSVQNLMVAYSTGLGSGISRFKLRLHALQVDNQLPLSPMPVLLRPPKVGEETDYIMKVSVTMQSNGSHDLCVYPYIGIQFEGPENSTFFINIHEPIIWRIHEMVQKANLRRLYKTPQTVAVSVDPIIQIGVLDLSEVRFKVSMSMSPSQRPRGVLGFWSSLMTALGNTENMPVKINQIYHQNVSMRQSSMISNAILNIRKDLLSQPFQLLSGVDILGNASNALGNMSKGVAALSMDEEFIQSRHGQENKGVEDIGDVIREGGRALAKGLFRGVTGILTKPLEGAKSSGFEGFVQGVGKGIIGVAAQPMSGVLDLLSKTTEGANAMRMKILSAITSEDQLLRRRLSRAIGGDNLLQPFEEYKAQGQVILQLAECGSFLGQVDVFKVRGKFALSDSYEDHFLLPKGKIVVVTHRRVILLQQTSSIIAQKKFNPARDPCSVLWDVLWDDLARAELTHGRKDGPKSPCSRLVFYLKSGGTDQREQLRAVKCSRETQQAMQVYNSIERALNTFGPNKSKEMLKNKVTKPYSPSTNAEPTSRESDGLWSLHQVPLSSTFGNDASI